MQKLFVWIIIVIVLAVGAKKLFSGDTPLSSSGELPKMQNEFPPGSPLYAQHQKFVDAFNADPKLRERFADVTSSKGLYAELQRALRRGSQSLGEQRIIGMLKAMAAITPRLPPESCAKLMLPQDDFDHALGADVRAALEKLPAVHHQRMTDFYLDALRAEVNNARIIPVTAEARENALYEISFVYQGAERERLGRVLTAPASTSAEDRCWAANTFMNEVSQLAPENAVNMARIMWGAEG